MHNPLVFISSFITSSHDFFSAFLSSYDLEHFLPLVFYLSLFHPFFQGAQFISVWSLPDDSLYLPLLVYPSTSHSEFYPCLNATFYALFSERCCGRNAGKKAAECCRVFGFDSRQVIFNALS